MTRSRSTGTIPGSEGICGCRSVCSRYDRRSTGSAVPSGLRRAVTFPVTAQSPNEIRTRVCAPDPVDHLQVLLVGDRSLDQDDVHALGVGLDVDDRGVDEVGPVGQLDEELVEVEERHVAARAAAEPDGRELQTFHCFFSRAVTRNASTPRSCLDSATVEPWAKIAPVGQAWRHLPQEVQVIEVPQGWFMSVITRAVGAAAGDVPGVGPLDLVAGPHAAGAEDAAVVVDAEPRVADVDLASRVQVVVADVVDAECDRQVLELAVAVGHADRADVIPLGEAAARRSSADIRGVAACRSGSIMSSSTRVTQAGRRRPPAISTRQSRQAPTSEVPSRWQSVGIANPGLARRLEDRLVLAGAQGLPVDRECLDRHASPALLRTGTLASLRLTHVDRAVDRGAVAAAIRAAVTDQGLVLVAEVAERAEHRVGGRLAQPAEAGVLDHVAERFEQVQIGCGCPAPGRSVARGGGAARCPRGRGCTCRTTRPCRTP